MLGNGLSKTTGNNTISDLQINGHTVTAGNQAGILALTSAKNIVLKDLVITSFTEGGALPPVGIEADSQSEIRVDNSVIAVSHINGNATFQGIVVGDAQLTLNDSVLLVNEIGRAHV